MNRIEAYKEAVESYYKTENSTMSDISFDELEEELQTLGFDTRKIKEKIELKGDSVRKVPMSSLAKIKDTRFLQQLVNENTCYVEPKYDGLSLELIYDSNGKLAKARGRSGVDYTEAAMNIKSVYKQLALKAEEPRIIRGEVVIAKDTPLPERYKNRRNAASGILNSKELSKDIDLLDFVAYEVIFNEDDAPSRVLTSDSRYTASQISFNSIHPIDFEELESFASDQPFETDGVVFKIKDYRTREKLGFDGFHKFEYAYKFADKAYKTKLINVTYQVSANGKLTPIANFEEVVDSIGSMKKASLSSIANVEALDLREGDTLYVKRANMVIPYVDRSENDGSVRVIESTPSSVIVDGAYKETYRRGAHLFIDRRMYDDPFSTIKHQISILGAKNIVAKKVQRAVDSGCEDIFDFTSWCKENNELNILNKLMNPLYTSRTTGQWIMFLNLEGVGAGKIKLIDEQFDSLYELLNTFDDYITPDILPVSLENAIKKNIDIIERLAKKVEALVA